MYVREKWNGYHMETGKKWVTMVLVTVICWVLGTQINGCKFKIIPEEMPRREIPFVIVSEECIPEELKSLIEKKKESEIKLTYVDEEHRYIIVGYGKQDTGGYSIYIKDLYVAQNAIYVDTCLMGPKIKSKKNTPSYPVIVLQISEMGLPVVFE